MAICMQQSGNEPGSCHDPRPELWHPADAAPGSMWTPHGAAAQGLGDFLKTSEHVVVQSDHLGNDDVWIFSVLRQALHHGAKQGLREPGSAVQRLFHGQPSRALSTLHLRPDLFKQHSGTPHTLVVSRIPVWRLDT